MRIRRVEFLGSVVLAVPLASRVSAQAAPVIRVGATGSDSYAEAYYAREMGFFERAGLKVDLVPFSSGAAIATGVTSGTVDVGISNVPHLARAVASGSPFIFIAGGGMYSASAPMVGLCVGTASTIRTAKDFEGRTVAVTAPQDQAEVGINDWLDKNGADYTKVHFIEIPFPDMPTALGNGLAQGALITEPWLTQGVRGGKIRVLAWPYNTFHRNFLIGVWFTTASWYAKNASLAKRFTSVIYATAKWANAHQDVTAKLIAKSSKIDLQTTRSMKRAYYATNLDPQLVQMQIDQAYKYHVVEHPLTAQALIAQ